MTKIYNFLYIEDEDSMIDTMESSVKLMNRTSDQENTFEMTVAKNSDDALKYLDKNIFDFVLIDIKLKGGDSGDIIIDKIKEDYKIPCAILSGTPIISDTDFIKTYIKSNYANEEVLNDMASMVNSGLFTVIGEHGIIESSLKKLFWENYYKNIDHWIGIRNSLNEEEMKQLVLRYTISHLYELLGSESDQYEAIEMFINPNITIDGIKTGTILEELESETQYIVLSPPCDLAIRDGKPKNEFIILVEIDKYNDYIPTGGPISKTLKGKIKTLITNNHSDNLYWLSNYFEIFNGGFVNFRKIKTESFERLSNDKIYKKLIKLQDSFVKSLLSKFSIYYNRQGQPDFDFEKVTDEIANKFVGSES